MIYYLGIQYKKNSELSDSISSTITAFTNYGKTGITNADGVNFAADTL